MHQGDEFRDITRQLYEVISRPAGERDRDNERDGVSLQDAGLSPASS